MNRRAAITAASVVVGVVGLGALVGTAAHFGVLRDDDDDDDEGQEGLVRGLRTSKINLQQGLTASEQEGQPIAGKFEVERGKVQLSVYTVKDGKFSELRVDPATGNVANVEPITRPDALATAQSQNAAMAGAKISLKDAVDKAVGEAGGIPAIGEDRGMEWREWIRGRRIAGAHAVGVIPNLKAGHPVASVLLLQGERFTIVQQPLD
jgi:hypothetical protein